MNTANCCKVDTCRKQWFLYLLYYVKWVQPVPLWYKYHLWWLIQYWSPTRLHGPCIQVHETCHVVCDDNSYHWCTTNTTDGNWYCGMCVCVKHFILWRPQQWTGLLLHFLSWCYVYKQIIPIGMGTGNLKLNVKKGHWNFGKICGALLHRV